MFFFLNDFRNSLGRNDNPTALDIKSATKLLLVCHPLLTSAGHNVISNATGILTTSSVKKKQAISKASTPKELTSGLELDIFYEAVMVEEIESMEPYEQHMTLCAYIASCIEEKFLKNFKQFKHKSAKCVEVITAADDKIEDTLLSMKGDENIQPSESTLKLVIFANAVMKMFSEQNEQGNDFDSILKTICESLDLDNFYKNNDLLHDDQNDHKKELISELIKTYMIMKSQRIGKKITDTQRGKLRYTRKRAHILAGQ